MLRPTLIESGTRTSCGVHRRWVGSTCFATGVGGFSGFSGPAACRSRYALTVALSSIEMAWGDWFRELTTGPLVGVVGTLAGVWTRWTTRSKVR